MGRNKRRVEKRKQAKTEEAKVQESHVHKERIEAAKRQRQRTIMTWGFVGISVVLIALLVYSLWPKPSIYTAFASCITENGAVMYGTDWCPHCQEQKRLFGTAFKQVAYENCDYSRECQARGVTGYPTWIFDDGTRLGGTQPLEVLANKTGCTLPQA